MKKVFLFLAMGVLLFAGCKPRETEVNPDSVFGQHYDAFDFQIWFALNDSDEAYTDLISMMNVDSNVNVLGYGLQVQPTDADAVMTKALNAVMDYADIDTSHAYMPVWQVNCDSTLLLFFTYGIGAPDTELPVLVGSEVEKAKTYYDKSGVEVAMLFNKEAADRWAQITADNLGRNVVIMLGEDREGRVLSAPRIMGEITGGRCSVSGLTVDEAKALTMILNNNNTIQ